MTGAATPARSSALASSGTDSSASTAWPMRVRDLRGRDPRRQQLAGAPVAALARQRRRDQVAGARQPDHRLRPRAQALGVAPDLGEDVSRRRSGGIQPLRLGRPGRERRGVLGGARQLDADRVVGLLADDSRAREHLRQRSRQLLLRRRPPPGRRRRAPSPARGRARRDRRRARPRTARSAPSSAAARPAGRGPWRPTRRPCAARARPRPACRSPRRGRARARPGTRSPPAPPRPRPARCAAAPGSSHAGQVGAVLALAPRSRSLLGRARLQRRAQPAARQQHGQRGPERARPDHGRAPDPRCRARACADRPARPNGRARSRLGLGHLMSEPSDPRDGVRRHGATGPATSDVGPRCSRRPGSIEELAAAIGRGCPGRSAGARRRRRSLLQRHRPAPTA